MRARIALVCCSFVLALSSCNEETAPSFYSLDPSFNCFFEEYKNHFGTSNVFSSYLGNVKGWEVLTNGPNDSFGHATDPACTVYDDLFVSAYFHTRACFHGAWHYDPLTGEHYEKTSYTMSEEHLEAIKRTGPFFSCGLPLFWRGHTILSTSEAFYYGLVGTNEIDDMVLRLSKHSYIDSPSQGCPIDDETPDLVPLAPLDDGESVRSKILDDAYQAMASGTKEPSEIVGVDDWFTIGHRVTRNNLWIPNFFGVYDGAYVVNVRYRTFLDEERIFCAPDKYKDGSSIPNGRRAKCHACSYYGDEYVELDHPLHVVKLGSKELSFPFASQIPVVYKNGEFHSLEEAFASGLLDSLAADSIKSKVEEFYQTQIKPDQAPLDLPA